MFTDENKKPLWFTVVTQKIIKSTVLSVVSNIVFRMLNSQYFSHKSGNSTFWGFFDRSNYSIFKARPKDCCMIQSGNKGQYVTNHGSEFFQIKAVKLFFPEHSSEYDPMGCGKLLILLQMSIFRTEISS